MKGWIQTIENGRRHLLYIWKDGAWAYIQDVRSVAHAEKILGELSG